MKRQMKSLHSSLGKRFLSTVVSAAMAVTLMPALPASQVNAAEPELLKAGAINAANETVTQGQPFPSGTAGSTYFRIPAFIVTQNGNLLAAADARYSTTGDGGGLDTIASVSMDGGETWNYSFPLYFPDSDGYVGPTATTIIDPMLVQDEDGVIYCMADVNPTGVTTMGGYTQPRVGTGFITVDGKERLALTSDYNNVNTLPTDDNTTVYEYYVGDWNEQGYAPVKNRSDNSDSQYAVDKWYNIYTAENGQYLANLTQKQVNSDTDIQQNAFYAGSVLHVYNTGYMMYAVSRDDGMTWGDPEILNPEVKRDDGSESGLLVSPGQGLLLSDGTLIIPFYNHGDDEENASIAWRDKGSDTWKRSNDVPGAGSGGWWSSESEAVELSDGTVRLFVRSGTGTVTYADAKRDDSNNFVFSAPVDTGVACTSTCNVTAIRYSKKIDGKDAILVAMPTGGSRANGKIFTFLVNDDESQSLTLKSTYSVPNSSGAYAYSCMSELPDGTIGLLWENSGAAIRYDNFNITDLVPNGYVEGAEIDVELWSNETYTREYKMDAQYASGIENESGINENVAAVQVSRDPETVSQVTVIPLYPHIANKASSLDSFSGTADSTLDIANAEFTITATGTADVYTVQSETTGLYLTNANVASTFFSDTAVNNMKIVQGTGEETFHICKDSGQRYVIFYETNMDFNSNSAYGNGGSAYEITLLEKQDNVTVNDPVPGYKAVSEITSGKKYLISYIWSDGSVVILYPTNGTANQTKLVGEAAVQSEEQTTTVVITGVNEGETKAVIDGVTYNITCKGNPKINLVAGQTYFVEGAQTFSSANSDIVTVEAGTEQRNALFDCEGYSNGNLDGYSDSPNWDIDMLEAEFVVEESGENYTIFSQVENVYLVNQNATNYFTTSPITQSLIPVENSDGTISFEIRRVSDDNLNGRYVYFFYERMGFDAVGAKTGFEDRGDFGFEFLEKQDTVTNLDPIPGYKRVSEITSGKSYLITEYYDNGTESGIIVLYPRIGITNQSKLYQAVDIEGAVITAKAGGTAQVTIDGIIYDVIIGECLHDGGTYVPNAAAATCSEEGYTGDTYCSLCNEKLETGTVIEPLGHDWDEGVITTQPTLETDGVITYTCKRDASHTYTATISSMDYAKDLLNAAIADAAAKLDQTDVYTETTLDTLNNKLTAANGVKDSEDKAAIVSALNELQAAIGGLVTKELQTAIDNLNEIIGREIPNLDAYTEDTQKALSDARTAAQALLGSGNATAAQLKAEYDKVQKAIDGLVTKTLQAKIDNLAELLGTNVGELDSYTEETRAALLAAVEKGQELLQSGTATEEQLQAAYDEVAAAINALVPQAKADADAALDVQLKTAEGLLGQTGVYTAESLAALQTAYNAAQAARNGKDAAAVTAAMEQLKTAIANLKKIPAGTTPAVPAIEQGKIYDSGSYYYKVTSTSAKTVVVTGLKDTAVTKVVIYSSVKLGNETYKVTGVAANAFKGNKKITSVTVKKGVLTIGANAFSGCTKLKKVVINSTTLKSIGKKAFYNCKKLTSITVKSKSLKTVGKQALKGIHAKCTIKVPKAKKAAYTKIFKGRGQKATVTIK